MPLRNGFSQALSAIASALADDVMDRLNSPWPVIRRRNGVTVVLEPQVDGAGVAVWGIQRWRSALSGRLPPLHTRHRGCPAVRTVQRYGDSAVAITQGATGQRGQFLSPCSRSIRSFGPSAATPSHHDCSRVCAGSSKFPRRRAALATSAASSSPLLEACVILPRRCDVHFFRRFGHLWDNCVELVVPILSALCMTRLPLFEHNGLE